ncbi:hypothetical protein HZU75_04835 [Chitinibacter fontanus]|uniref:Tetratricopeptide repeat protein n=1 Tax=Chitinibacter fontanus TaxID=1737446 RepID=A0A7D5ZCZ2_9NEIS|nr:hypothetical protein [Chitinibacter fontanus]QLI80904.1 hypothetical protein HZU75_04835 [Chitinibacter fontanus]
MHLPTDVDNQIAELVSAVELGYWQSDASQHIASKKLLDLCLAHQHTALGYAYLLYGRTFLMVGKLEQAKILIEKGTRFCKKKKDNKHLVLGLLWLGLVFNKQHRYVQAFNCWCGCLAIALEISSLEVAVEAYLNLGILYQEAGFCEEAQAILMSCFSMSELIANKKLLAKSGIFLSDLFVESKDYDSALAIISRAELDIILYSDVTWIVQLCRNKAICYWRSGNCEAAIENYESGLVIARKFEMAWAYILVALAYADFLLENNEDLKAHEVLNGAVSYFALFSDDELRREWLWMRYVCSKKLACARDALQYLKQYLQLTRSLDAIRKLDGFSISLRRKISGRYLMLRREFRKFERIIDVPNVRMTIRQIVDFKERCERMLDVGRLIEIIVSPESRKIIEQRALMVISDYCSSKDVWLDLGNAHYYIIPEDNGKSLYDFSERLCKAIESQPWSRLNIKHVSVRRRLLLINQEILGQVNQIHQRGWHDAR